MDNQQYLFPLHKERANNMLNLKYLSVSTAAAILGTLLLGTVEPTNAASLTIGSINLKNGTYTGNFSNNFVRFVQSPTAGVDGYYETVLKITLDPNYLFTQAIFDIKYDARPNGMTVNIGDSATNNGHGGDGSTQNNDAEMQIGVTPTDPSISAALRNDMIVYGNDYFHNGNPLLEVSDIVTANNTTSTAKLVSLVVSNQYLQWNNNNGVSGFMNSPFLYALAGQADGEGPVNYDIFAGFNRSIGSPDRWGTGVSEVTITLVPEPTTVIGSCLALGVGGFLKKRHSNKQNQA